MGKQIYVTMQASVSELNFIFQSIADRLDAIEGIRGLPEMHAQLDMNNNKVVRVSSPESNSDAAILLSIYDIDGDVSVSGSINGHYKFTDSNGVILHEMGA